MSIRLLLEAHDVWFFRTSRPFGSAQATASDGEPFLVPPPGVVFGALRAAIGKRQDVSWTAYRENWKGWNDGPVPEGWIGRLGPPTLPKNANWPNDSVRLRGCLPARVQRGRIEPLFPLPSCVLLDRDHASTIVGRHLELVLPRPSTVGRSSAAGLSTVTARDDFEGETEPLLIDGSSLAHLLVGHTPASFNTPVLRRGDLAEGEPRVGIAREIRRRTVRRGLIYSQQTYRWNSRIALNDRIGDKPTFGLQALVENLAIGDIGSRPLLTLGGERRLAWGQVQSGADWLDPARLTEVRPAIEQKRGWWLYLATAALFHDGWRPYWLRGDSASGWTAELPGPAGTVTAGKLVGLIGDAPVLQSGWDLAARDGRGAPRPARRLMPEGTSWFFELPDGAEPAAVDAVMALQGTCIADDLAHAGCGLAFIGAWERGERE